MKIKIVKKKNIYIYWNGIFIIDCNFDYRYMYICSNKLVYYVLGCIK